MASDRRLTGLFVPTTEIYDAIQLLEQYEVTSPEFKELIIRLYQNTNRIAESLNLKDSGIYDTEEFVNGQTWFTNTAVTNQAQPFRQVLRKVINFGTLPNTGTTSVAHGIAPTTSYQFTRIYGCSTDPAGQNYIPLPYAGAANSIELNADATNVNITTTTNRTAFTTTFVVLEYLPF
jgi:hypothetical protein